MLCEKCGKNKASIHLTKIVNGSGLEVNLCEDCAKSGEDFNFQMPFSFEKLIASLIGSIEKEADEKQDPSKICEKCGSSYRDFKRIGKFGCGSCFETFGEEIDSLLVGIHGHKTHRGKIPKNADVKIYRAKEIQSLEKELLKAVEREDFEEAVILRDKIKEKRKTLEEGELA